MINAYKQFWKRYTDFSGRSSRSEYWWSYLCQVLITIPFSLILFSGAMSVFMSILPYISESGELTGISEEMVASIILNQLFSPLMIFAWLALLIFGLASIVPGLAITVRRLRDAGFHWAFLFISLIPYVGGLILTALLIFPTKEKEQDQANNNFRE
ncbi:DUF805 domain-containing protein [Streptococcus caprae]|uniref:DUF805 domain-containing protein n=1 Tax=Streptococcus caprae TaxID=1640501 RepID=A0ABV8CWW6_9STRE